MDEIPPGGKQGPLPAREATGPSASHTHPLPSTGSLPSSGHRPDRRLQFPDRPPEASTTLASAPWGGEWAGGVGSRSLGLPGQEAKAPKDLPFVPSSCRCRAAPG